MTSATENVLTVAVGSVRRLASQIAVIESLGQLRESAEYELCGIVERGPGMLVELADQRATLLEQESTELQQEAERLAEEIKELSEQASMRIA